MLVLNYPNNPTGASSTPEFFAEVVEFAEANDLIVIRRRLHRPGLRRRPAAHFLATPGANVGIELIPQQKFQHDRLALRLRGRQPVARERTAT